MMGRVWHASTMGSGKCGVAISLGRAPGKASSFPHRSESKILTGPVGRDFAFRCSWRQMNTELVSRTDKQQRRLYGCALAHRMRADETMEQFMNRRKHAALTEVRRHGKWSWKAAVRIVLWDLHLPRNHSGAWVCGLRNWKGDIWLRTRRMLMNPVSISVALRELAVLQGIPGPGGTKAFNSLWTSSAILSEGLRFSLA